MVWYSQHSKLSLAQNAWGKGHQDLAIIRLAVLQPVYNLRMLDDLSALQDQDIFLLL